jgi:cytochrome c
MSISPLGLFTLLLVGVFSFSLQATAAPGPKRVLFFHKQNGYVHVDTDSGVKVMKADWEKQGIQVETSLNPADFTKENLARFGVIAFINTNYRNGHMLNRSQEAAIEEFVQQGHGFVCIHSAIPLNGAVEETVWPWYFQMTGARFASHPDPKTASIVFLDRTHLSSQGLPEKFDLWDEWYRTQQNPKNLPGVKVIAKMDESGVPGGDPNLDQPVTWVRNFEGGNVFVTLAGHDLRAYQNPLYLSHIRGGVTWAGAWDSTSTSLLKTDEYRTQKNHARNILRSGEPLRSGHYPGIWVRTPNSDATESWERRNFSGRLAP